MAGAAAALLLGGVVEVAIHRYDPTRIVYKRWKAADRYVYDEVAPHLLKIDPRTLIAPDVRRDPQSVRARLIGMVWGADGYPADLLPETVEAGVTDHPLPRLAAGVRVDRLRVVMEHGLWSTLYYLRAPRPNNRLVLYHHGFGEKMETVTPLLNGLLAGGYDVLAINALGNAGNAIWAPVTDGSGGTAHLFFDLQRIDRPLRFHLEPVIAGLNHVLQSRTYLLSDMIGFSMGGFMTVLAAAIEPRVERSYPIAGTYPNYLRTGQEVMTVGLPYYPQLLAIASQLDLYVLGAAGSRRSQLQIFNRYDRCCFNGVRGKVYENAVRDAVAGMPGGGAFAVVLDESHADHRVSRFTIKTVLADLARAR